MSLIQSEIDRLARKQENITHRERIQLIETDQEMAQVLDLKCKDMSAVVLMKFKGLMENLDLMVEEIRDSLKNDLKEILGVESKIPEVKNPKNSSTKKECQQIKGLATQNKGLVENIEGANSKIVEDVENLTFKRKEINEPSSRLDKAEEYSTNQGKELSYDESQNYKVMESMEEAISNIDNTWGDSRIHMEVTGENIEIGEGGVVKAKREEKIPQNLNNNKVKILKASREDEGAVLRLAADFSSATLDISKQWSNVFNILRENDFEPQVLCQVQLAFKCDGEVRTFSDIQSLSNFTSQKPFMKELLKDILPQSEKIKKGGRRYGIREKVGKTLLDSKHGAGGDVGDGLSFLFVKEVKVAEPQEVKNLETQEEESSEWETEEEEEASELEGEGGETSELDEEEEASGMEEEEEEETSELDEEEEASGLQEEEEEEASVLCEKQDSTFQCHSLVNTKCGVEEKTSNGLEIVLIKEVEDSEPEEEEGSEWEMEVVLSWEEGEDSEVENVKPASPVERKEASYGPKEIAYNYLAPNFEKEKLAKHRMLQKTQNKEETATPRNQGVGTVCPTWCFVSPSKSLERSSDEQKRHLYTKSSTPSGISRFSRKTEKERQKTPQTGEQTSKETDLIQETEENFRRSITNNFREIQEEVANIKSYLPEVLEIKNSIDVLNSRIDLLEERMDNLEDHIEEFSKDTMQMAKQIINRERSRDIEDRSRSSNIRLIGIPEKDNKENGAEEIMKELIEENFPELKDSSLEIVSAYRIPSKIDEKRLTPRHILVKFGNSNDKEKIIKASRKRREITYRGTRIRLTADLSLDTLDARSKWSNIIKVLQAKGFTPKILYPAKLAFSFEGKTKTFFDTEEFTKFISCIPSLQELLEDLP
ncbi:LINE-1 type transposase domain-containing protein 1 [Herpailurus yagouaroundi]|uniref:LINE-1 type transposase domain-containing protein 1 n=1 Tax=Herpailurus yagouaroundi TaxID=1608482 RepID=UPI001AD6DF03|nr:LINE-1 type transposase domain-containing protein 1 [Puma yagouaroundi]XP_040326375.1 LINE-1 type transposase domain-containing protein 1 [Puma yagouaroundi]